MNLLKMEVSPTLEMWFKMASNNAALKAKTMEKNLSENYAVMDKDGERVTVAISQIGILEKAGWKRVN